MRSDLFAPQPAGLAWRAPTEGEHVCAGCQGAACYGLGSTWFCPRCAPADFLPATRGERR
ncbi:MAG: hypothetical protein AB1942_20030 [Pseudomonadota bacterium]